MIFKNVWRGYLKQEAEKGGGDFWRKGNHQARYRMREEGAIKRYVENAGGGKAVPAQT